MTAAGVSLAAAGLAALVLACRDCLRRRAVPVFPGDAGRPPGRWRRALWITALAAGWAGGALGPELASRERVRPDAAAGAAAARGRGESRRIRVPFYVRERSREPRPAGDGSVLVSREAVTVPWSFLLALALYGLLVVRGSRRPGVSPRGRASAPTGPAG